ncbi:thioredoxin family protein [Thalassobacter stenotrophicus]|uniref:AhpC/TSA family protein n=2 Tax=Thalassobacter stenotrophicus TaxID=266809 RepID=A0A0N7LTD3_9RHOB|nr:thioredoxin family protein [Thalassobacter stenotrophicus]PVZ47583.1 thioredoxin family protein [Thalassobacter stenotrophicus]CUH60378.1 AhpC/TSA family protein [Thalassobacter stenotrophicus]SHI73957.1 Peroxiredoxin [Thalassobacter stenotrophicus DSM 16310]
MALADTPVCDFGWPAPRFALSDPSGKLYDSRDLMGPGGLLVAFICNHCPYVICIAERLAMDLNALQGQGVGVAAIMSNDYDTYPADTPDKMATFAQRHGFDFPYLVDTDQSVARAFGAVCTPDFFGFNAIGALQYRGRLDDGGHGANAPRRPELRDAMLQIADTGTGPRDQIASMGCSLKWR